MTELRPSLSTKSEVSEFRSNMKRELQLFRRDLAAMERRLTVKLGAITATAIGLTVALVKLL